MFTNVTFVRTNFNSHAHVERDAHGVKKQDITPISTHTLTWSVTNSSTFVAFFGWISTHTLTWSVTTETSFNSSFVTFQLTRSRGA